MSAFQPSTAPPAPPSPDIAPAAPDAPPAPATVSMMPDVPRTMQELFALRARREELSNQLVSVTSRRNQLAQRLRTAQGADRLGLEQRLQFLDKRILQLESDIDVTGRDLTAAPATLLASSQSTPFGGGRFRDNFPARAATTIGSLFTLLVFAPLAFAAARLMWRRAAYRPPTSDPETAQRLARLETAVDTIAVEVERVAEGQRFLTRLLAESSAPPAVVGVPAEHATQPIALSDRGRSY